MSRQWLNDLETYQAMEERGHLYWQGEDMPKLNEMFGGSYLKAADLDGKRVKVVISNVRQQLFVDDKTGGEESKWIVEFEGKDRPLVLNKTNATAIGSMYGDDTDGWIGKEIKLYPTTTDLRGEQVACIRVWLEVDVPDAEDEIPF